VALVEFYNKISVQSLLRVSKLVITLHLYRKENPDTLTIVVINQTFLCVFLVDEPLQEFYVGEHWSSACYHVQVQSLDIRKNFVIELSHIGVAMQDIFWEFFLDDFLEDFSQCGSTALVPVFASVSPKARG
jgi:hypothetical protein